MIRDNLHAHIQKISTSNNKIITHYLTSIKAGQVSEKPRRLK